MCMCRGAMREGEGGFGQGGLTTQLRQPPSKSSIVSVGSLTESTSCSSTCEQDEQDERIVSCVMAVTNATGFGGGCW